MFDELIEKLKEMADEIVAEAIATIEGMNEWQEWNSIGEILDNFKAVAALIVLVVQSVEEAAGVLKDEGMEATGGEKLDAAVGVLDGLIKLPWYLEKFDGVVIKVAISTVVFCWNMVWTSDWDLDTMKDKLIEYIKDQLDFTK